MSTDHAPITPVRTYVAVFVALLVLTGITVLRGAPGLRRAEHAGRAGDRRAPRPRWSSSFFMGVRYNTPLTKVVVVSGFFWLLILFGLGMSDYLTRGWLRAYDAGRLAAWGHAAMGKHERDWLIGPHGPQAAFPHSHRDLTMLTAAADCTVAMAERHPHWPIDRILDSMSV